MKRSLLKQYDGRSGIESKEFNQENVIFTFETAMQCQNIELKRSALNVICRACRHVGFPFCRYSARVVRIIREVKNIPDDWRWKAYFQINETLGVGSTLHVHFSEFSGQLIKCLNDVLMTSFNDLILLLVSLFRTSLPLLNPRSIIELQSVVCLKALSFCPEICVLKLLNTLLQFNHDEVPIPLQVAQTVFNRFYLNESAEFVFELERGRTLAAIYSRPKLPVISTNLFNSSSFPSLANQINVMQSVSSEISEDMSECPKNSEISENIVEQINGNNKKLSQNMTEVEIEVQPVFSNRQDIDESDESVEVLSDSQSVEFLSADQMMTLFRAEK